MVNSIIQITLFASFLVVGMSIEKVRQVAESGNYQVNQNISFESDSLKYHMTPEQFSKLLLLVNPYDTVEVFQEYNGRLERVEYFDY